MNIDDFMTTATPGMQYVYYTGETPTNRPEPNDIGYNDCPFRIAGEAELSGNYVLFQRKVGSRLLQGKPLNRFEYVMVKLSKDTASKRQELLTSPNSSADFDFRSMGGKKVSKDALAVHMEMWRLRQKR
jgi:hypothetical protein